MSLRLTKRSIYAIIVACLMIFWAPLSVEAAVNAGFVSGFWFSPGDFYADDTVRLHAAIRNHTDSIFKGTAVFYDNDTEVNSQPFEVASGEVHDVSILWEAVAGKHTFEVKFKDLNISEGDAELLLGGTVLVSSPVTVDIDTDGDNVGDSEDTDDDNDQLSDSEEVSHGTDPKDPDSDNDGISDGEEVSSGTDPNDASDPGGSENSSNTQGDSSEGSGDGEDGGIIGSVASNIPISDGAKKAASSGLEAGKKVASEAGKVAEEGAIRAVGATDSVTQRISVSLHERSQEIGKNAEIKLGPVRIWRSTFLPLPHEESSYEPIRKLSWGNSLKVLGLATLSWLFLHWRIVVIVVSLIVLLIIWRRWKNRRY